MESLGISVKKDALHAKQLKCVRTVQRCVSEDEDVARRVLEACISIAGDYPISGSVLSGLFRLVLHFEKIGIDVLSSFSSSIGELTQPEVERAIRQKGAEVGRGGNVVAAKALMDLINKRKRTNRLVWE